MLSVSEVRKILDKIAVEAGIQKIDEQEYGYEVHNVFTKCQDRNHIS